MFSTSLAFFACPNPVCFQPQFKFKACAQWYKISTKQNKMFALSFTYNGEYCIVIWPDPDLHAGGACQSRSGCETGFDNFMDKSC